MNHTEPGNEVDERSQEMAYETFLAERQKIVDARQRTQQRFDQIVSAGAAGALVLSITFLERIAPSPDPTNAPGSHLRVAVPPRLTRRQLLLPLVQSPRVRELLERV